MMRKYAAISALGVFALGAFLCFVQPVSAEFPGPTPSPFVGTGLAMVTFDDGQNQVTFPAIGSLHADGTITYTDGNDFMPDQFSAVDGVSHGSWVKVGPNTARGLVMYHSYDADGNIAFTGRNDFELTLVDDADLYAVATGVGRVFFPGTDPLDVDQGIVVGTFEMAIRRLDP